LKKKFQIFINAEKNKNFLFNFSQLLKDESVAANEIIDGIPDADVNEKRDTEGNVQEKSDQFVVTQEYIQDSMCFFIKLKL
jgi:hypothetical protein